MVLYVCTHSLGHKNAIIIYKVIDFSSGNLNEFEFKLTKGVSVLFVSPEIAKTFMNIVFEKLWQYAAMQSKTFSIHVIADIFFHVVQIGQLLRRVHSWLQSNIVRSQSVGLQSLQGILGDSSQIILG